jgi:hypothetical protein
MPIDPDDTRSAPFANLCHRPSNAVVCADDQQGLAGSNPGIFNHPYPGGEVDETYRRGLFQQFSQSMNGFLCREAYCLVVVEAPLKKSRCLTEAL